VIGKTNNILQLKNLSIGYDKPIQKNINLFADKTELISVIGKNGIGKSTLLRTIAGLQLKLSGDIYFEDKEIDLLNLKDKSKKISFVSTGAPNYINIKIRELVALGRFPHTNMFGNLSANDTKIINETICLTGIEHIAEKNIYEVSEGELQRAMIARALSQDTDLLIFDEPTAFLDIPNRYEILYLLKRLSRESNKTIIFSSHDLDIVMQLSDKIWLMKENEIIFGAPEDLVLNNNFEDLFINKNLKFVKNTGQFSFVIDKQHLVNIKGDGLIFEWTKKALDRAGFNYTCNKQHDVNVTILNSNNSIKWVFEKENNKFVFDSIYQLIKNINNLI